MTKLSNNSSWNDLFFFDQDFLALLPLKEPAARSCIIKYLFWKISQKSQEVNIDGVLFSKLKIIPLQLEDE